MRSSLEEGEGDIASSASPPGGCRVHTNNKDELLLPGAHPALLPGLPTASVSRPRREERAQQAAGRTPQRAPASPVLRDKPPAGYDAGWAESSLGSWPLARCGGNSLVSQEIF